MGRYRRWGPPKAVRIPCWYSSLYVPLDSPEWGCDLVVGLDFPHPNGWVEEDRRTGSPLMAHVLGAGVRSACYVWRMCRTGVLEQEDWKGLEG